MSSPFIITLSGKGSDGGDVSLRDFLTQLEAIKAYLNDIDSYLADTKTPNLDYRIVGLSMNSPAKIELEATILRRKNIEHRPNHLSDVFSKSIQTMKQINAAQRPDFPTIDLIDIGEKLSAPLNRGLTHCFIHYNEDIAEIDQKLPEKIDSILGADLIEQNNICGNLESVNIHDKNEFIIYPVVGAKKVRCTFKPNLFETVQLGLNRFVEATGELHTKRFEDFPYFAKITELKILPQQNDIPKLSEMGGMFKDAYDGKSIKEHLAEMRDGW